jgi:hypothetical protein
VGHVNTLKAQESLTPPLGTILLRATRFAGLHRSKSRSRMPSEALA